MKKLIVVINDLERSGNSTLARAIAHHLNQNEVKHKLITSDENDLHDTFEGEFWDLDEQLDTDNLIQAMETNEALVLDIHTGAARDLAEFCEAEELDNLLTELDVDMTLVIPDTGSVRCNEEIVDLTDLFADSADYVIARMPISGRDMMEWKGSDAAKSTRYLGSLNIEIAGFSDDLKTAMESTNVEITTALNKPESLPRFAEVQVCQWLEDISESFDEAAEFLIPEAVGEVVLDY